MRFPDSRKFPDLFHSPKIKILRICESGQVIWQDPESGNLMAPISCYVDVISLLHCCYPSNKLEGG
jgi:hypothetical protein